MLVARGDTEKAVELLTGLLAASPAFETTYVTLAKVYLTTSRTREGLQVVEQLLQRNPSHAVALEIVRQFKTR